MYSAYDTNRQTYIHLNKSTDINFCLNTYNILQLIQLVFNEREEKVDSRRTETSYF